MKCDYPKCNSKGTKISKNSPVHLCKQHGDEFDELLKLEDNEGTKKCAKFMLKITCNRMLNSTKDMSNLTKGVQMIMGLKGKPVSSLKNLKLPF